MSPIHPTRYEAFLSLPVRTGESWQGGVVALPGEHREGAAWASHDDLFLGATDDAGVLSNADAIEALLTLALDVVGYRPARLEVRDTQFACELASHLPGVRIEVVGKGGLESVRSQLAS